MNFGIFCFAFLAFVGNGISGQRTTVCDPAELRQCLEDLVTTTLLSVEQESSQEACSERNFTSFRDCTETHLEGCVSYFGDVITTALRPYVGLLDTVYQKACTKDYEYGDCDLSTARTCIGEFFHTFSGGGVARTCKQGFLTEQCLRPALDTCSDLSRYLVAVLIDEMKLTSDLLCQPNSCNTDIAVQLLSEAQGLLGLPATVVRQSSLICRELWTTLALVTNQTAECAQSDIPSGLWNTYQLLYTFAADYCEARTPDSMLTGVPEDLLLPVYLASVGTNRWTSHTNMCRLFNSTVVGAVGRGRIPGPDSQHLYTWRHALGVTLDRYSTACLNTAMFDCSWTERAAAGPGTCDVGGAEACLDMVLLSQLVVEVHLQRASWQTVCAAAYNMLACHQYHTSTCWTRPGVAALQQIEDLVGYECSQLGPLGSPDACDGQQSICDVPAAVGECETLARNLTNICRHQEEVYECFRGRTSGCNSAQASPAQFYLDWFLHDCSHNFSLLRQDNLLGTSQCHIQYGYNLYDGMYMSSDFSWIVCAAGSLLEQCMLGTSLPSLAAMYRNQYSDFSQQFSAAVCNLTRVNTSPLPPQLTEPSSCEIDHVSGEIAMVVLLLSDFPFLSVKDQATTCSIVPFWSDTVAARMVDCSSQRQALMDDTFVYIRNMHAFYCPASTPAAPNTCDIDRAYTCLEDFGRYAYFASTGDDHCLQLEEVYTCLYDSARHCDNDTQDSLVQEVRAIHSLAVGTTCPLPTWCSPDSRDVEAPWITEVCRVQDGCRIYNWSSCVEQYSSNLFCSNTADVVACIERQVSGCDAPQYLVFKLDIQRYISTLVDTFGSCGFRLDDPAYITQQHEALLQCGQMFTANSVRKEDICNSLNFYLQCVRGVDQTGLAYVWRAAYEANVQMWMKDTYIGCKTNTGDTFVVDPEYSRDDYAGTSCRADGIPCLQSLAEELVTTPFIVPLGHRQTDFCNRVQDKGACVMENTAGCTESAQRSLVTSTMWFGKVTKNIGTCSTGTTKPRSCDPKAAMSCLTNLGLELGNNINSQATNTACLKAMSAQKCVNEQTSSCDFETRSQLEATFSQADTIVTSFCTVPVLAVEDVCGSPGTAQCDVERALVCLVPTQALMLQQTATVEQVCSSVPAMKLCVERWTSGCDAATRGMLARRQFRLSTRLGHQCPQMFCEECQARACLRNLYQALQYDDVHICNVVREAKQCIHDNAQHCDMSVGAGLLQEVELLVGEDDVRLCEVTLPACLQAFSRSAMQIMGFPQQGSVPAGGQGNQTMTVADMVGAVYPAQVDPAYVCDQATAAYYCVEHHLVADNSSRQHVLLQTLTRIGEIVYDKCQGDQVQCYSCANATSNEECNSWEAQTCAPGQVCGTVVSNYYLSKGCVEPDLCQPGCYGGTCSYCCHGDFCNQPWNGVLTEPATCQPLNALWCGLQLLATSTQNATNLTQSCRVFGEHVSCMVDSTADCQQRGSMALGMLGHQLLATDALTTCLADNALCSCGHCTSLLLTTLVSSPYSDKDRFCNAVRKLYRQTLAEMDFVECDRETIHSTAYTVNNAVYMLQGLCPLNTDETDCTYNGTVFRHGASFQAVDGCNQCTCSQGNVACTLMMCPPEDRCPAIQPGEVGICAFTCNGGDDCRGNQICCPTACGGTSCVNPEPIGRYQSCRGNQICCPTACGGTSCVNPEPIDTKCHYNGTAYNSSTSFPSADGCNICVCLDNDISCSNFSCVPTTNFTSNATCDLASVQDCIDEASTNYQIFKEFGFGNDAICDEAATMLNCVEPKVSSCPLYVLENVREAVWLNFDEILDTCNIQAILQQYSNTTGQNLTVDPTCSVNTGLQCFTSVSSNDTCRSYEAISECVSQYREDCYSNSMAPVLFGLEKELLRLAEDCDIDVPGRPTTPPPTPGPGQPTDDHCSYGNRTRQSGITFRAKDGCNFCYCHKGAIACTELYCPYQGDTPACNITGVEQCIQDTYMAYFVSMATQDGGLQICLSAAAMVRCVEARTASCPNSVVTSVQNIVFYSLQEVSPICSLEQILYAYSQNTSQPPNHGNTCNMQAVMACLATRADNDEDDICRSQQRSLDCLYNVSQTCYIDLAPTVSTVMQHFQSQSRCNLINPHTTDKSHCDYGSQKYEPGDNFLALDGCNLCFCGENGMVGCTKMYCGDTGLHNASCDVSGVRECLEQAALPHLVSLATQDTTHICRAAAQLLRCVEARVSTCPGDVVQVLQGAVWAHLYTVQPYCQLNQLWPQTNNTIPDTGKHCELQQATNCVNIRQGDTTCSAYQSMIDCVYNFTSGCLSVDAVPVLYELQRQLEPASMLCDLAVPLMHFDAAYPVAQCTLTFAELLGERLTLGYLVTGRLDGVCGAVAGYLGCLQAAGTSTLGRLYASSARQAADSLVQLCDDYNTDTGPEPEEPVECHSCQEATSQEECDAQPSRTCQPNQVCSTGLQLDPYSGVTMVTKGCADLAWCDAMYGCNMQYMSCIQCCWGSHCNGADNTTVGTTTAAPRPSRTTAAPRPSTSSPQENENCNLEPVAIYMTAQVARLVNFNFIPLQQRKPICQNFEARMSSYLSELECVEVTRLRVKVLADWLTGLTDDACQQMQDSPVDETRCYQSLTCLDNFGNFTDQISTCRILNRTIGCLGNHSAYCQAPVQASVNRSIQLLLDMDHVICAANPLADRPQPPCVDLQAVTNRSICNQTAALHCAQYIEKAVNNPFMEKDKFCRIVKAGLACIRDNTYDCDSEVLYRVAPQAAQVIQWAQQACPEAWCPASDHCRLDTANHCLDTLETQVQEMITRGRVDGHTCMSVTETHQCVAMATEECYPVDRQAVLRRFSAVGQVVVPLCQAAAASARQCFTVYTEGISTLVSMDEAAVTAIVENVLTQVMLYGYTGSQSASHNTSNMYGGVNLPGGLYNTGQLGTYGGLNLPGGLGLPQDSHYEGVNSTDGMLTDFNTGQSNSGWENPYIRRRRQADNRGNPSPMRNNTNGPPDRNSTSNDKTTGKDVEPDYWTDKNSTHVLSNGTEGRGNHSEPGDGLPTGTAPPMAQSGEGSGPGDWQRLYSLLYGELSAAEYVHTLTSLANVSLYSVAAAVTPQVLMQHRAHKWQVCQLVQQASTCLNLDLHLTMLPPHTQYTLAIALNLLHGVAMETCQPQQCHSCNDLDSNELCNSQPTATCNPLEMCYVETSGDLISKGCAPIMTCEERCRHRRWDQACYCCQGNMCNKQTEQEKGRCDTQRAVACVQNLLTMATRQVRENSTELYSTAMCIVNSTSGCHSDAYRAVHKAGQRLLALYEVASCSAKYDRAFCGVPGAASLVTLASSPHQTPASTLETCRLLGKVLRAFTNTSCCEGGARARLALLAVYLQVEPFCPGLNVTSVCTGPGHNTTCQESGDGQQVLENVCDTFTAPREQNGSTTCNVSAALDLCFPALTTDPLSVCPSSAEGMASMRRCISEQTGGCSRDQQAPVLSVMRNLLLICPLHHNTTQDKHKNSSRASMAIQCLEPLGNLTSILSSSDHLHTDLCGLASRVDHCLKHSNTPVAVSGLRSLMSSFNTTFCHNQTEFTSDCEPDQIVQCFVDPCSTVNATIDCPAFPKAQCVSDYCGGCNTRFVFRGQEVTGTCQDMSQMGSCDVDVISSSVSRWMNLVLMSPLTGWHSTDRVCSGSYTMDDLRTAILNCPPVYSKPLSAMLSWLQGQLEDICYSHIANTPCVNPSCDVAKATEIINSMGYYLRTWSVDDKVFCQTANNTLTAVDCVLGTCAAPEAEQFWAGMTDVRAQVVTRCPHLLSRPHCHTQAAIDTATSRPAGPSSTDRPTVTTALPSRPTRPSNTGRPRPTGGVTGRPQGTSRPSQGTSPAPGASGEKKGCDVEAAKMCLYSAGLPAQNMSTAADYCSNLLSAVVRLSECVLSTTVQCDRSNVSDVRQYYEGIVGRYQAGCSLNMSRQLVARLEAGECWEPECSYYESHHCVMQLTADGGSCGNVEDVSDCVTTVSAGCGPHQRYINEAMVRTSAVSMLPARCWPAAPVQDTSDQPIIQCVEDLTVNLAAHAKGNTTGASPVCVLLGQFLGCLEAVGGDSRVPAPLAHAVAQLKDHAEPTLDMICSYIGPEDMKVMGNEDRCPAIQPGDVGICAFMCNGDDCAGDQICCPTACGGTSCVNPEPIVADQCSMDQALAILKSHIIDAVLAPIMTQDGKDYVCSYDMSTESWRGAFGYFVAGCSTHQRSDLQLVFDLAEGLGRLAGTCTPHPHTCAPGEAIQCVQELSATLERHRTWATDQHDVCRSSQRAQLCVEQTTSGCDRQVQASLQASFEAVYCEGLTICPALIDQESQNMSAHTHLPTCLSPTGAVEAGDAVCSPNKALQCLQSVSEVTLPESPQERGQVCRKYAESMECFMTNLGGCDNVTGMFVLSYGLRVAQKFGNSCPTEIKAFCDDKEHPGCSPRKIHRCLDMFQASADTDVEEEVCFAQEQLSQCVRIHAGSCPQLTRTFLHTQLVMGLADTDTPLHDPHCQSTGQCAYNYIRYMSGSFEQVVEVFGAEAGPVCRQETGESYECGARQGELECMRQGTSGLPDDVAQLVTSSLQYTEAVFTTACSALSGVTEELRGCGRDCLQCYLQEVRLQSYLPLMWTFTTEPQPVYNEQFCSFYGNWKAEVAEIEAVSDCYSQEDVRNWHEGYVSSLSEINDKYCSRPCNISLADSCIAQLQAALTGNDPCLAYEVAEQCLNASTVHCGVDVRRGYEAARDQALRDAGVRCYTLPSFQASVSSSTLLEGVPLSLSVTSTGSLVEKCLGSTCQVEISLAFDDSYSSSCSGGEAIPQILTDRCFVYFPANVSGVTHTFMLHVRLDHQVAPDRNVTVRLVGRLLEDGEVFAEEGVGETRLHVENRDTSGTCSMIGQPSIRTFDGMMYMNLGKGEYVVYQHTSLPEQVNVRFQSCGGALNACPCGVMVQSGDDVYVLDACQRVGQAPQSLTFRVYKNGDYTPHTRVHYDFDGRSTQFVLPSGMIVFVRSVQQQELDVWLHPTGLAWNSTQGLCGTFDGDTDNDFTYPDGTVESLADVWVWRGSLLPFYFLREWRSANTLMYGPVQELGGGTRNNTGCVCEGRAGCLATDLVETCTFVLSDDYNGLLYLFEVDQGEAEVGRRRKRQAPGEFEEGDVTLEMLEDAMLTASNVTEAGAQQYCQDTIFSTGFWNVCSVIVSTDRTVPDCINTILISDSYTAVVTTIEDLKIQCATAIQTDPSLSQFLNMTDEILVPYVLNLTCLEDCSSNGLCVNGECVCSPGYRGDACNLQDQNAPTLLKLSEDLYTDQSPTTDTAVTRLVDIQGNAFTHSDTLTCHTEQVQLSETGYSRTGVTSEQSAIFLTGGSVRCQVTGSLPLTGLLLSVSNNGLNQSNGLLYIIQDRVCYDCNVAGGYCNQQPTSCVVDDACYGAGDYKPGDSCLVCDPISNVFQYKPSTSCPDNATTTTTTTTISTPSSSSPTPSPSSSTPSSSTTSGPTPSPSSPTPSSSSPTPSPSSPTPTSSSPTPSPSTPTPSSPTPTPSSPTPSSPTPSTSSSEGVTEKQEDDEDDRTMLIIIISVAGLMVIVVFTVVICIALRLKRSDQRRHDQSMSSSETPSTLVKAKRGNTHLQGRLNPYFQEVEYATAHGQDQPVIARRAAPTLSAPFNPQGLSQGAPVRGQAGAEGMYEINIGMFEDEKKARGQPKPTHTWEEVGYRIPRPATSAVYDNAPRRSPDKQRKAEEDTPYELGTFTHL